MKILVTICIASFLIAANNKTTHSLVGKWKLEQLEVKNRTIFQRGTKDSTANIYSEIFFETPESKLAAIDKSYNEMSNIFLLIKSKKAKQGGHSNQWVNYVLHDSILEMRLNKVTIEYVYHLNEDLTRLELKADTVVTTFSRMK